MTLHQKVVHRDTIPSTHLETWLNKEGGEGWRLFDASPVITNKGGAIFIKKNGYYFDDYLFLFSKSEGTYLYKCITIPRSYGKYDKNLEEMNDKITSLNQEGFELMKILAPGVISSLQEYPTKGSVSYIMIFMKEGEEIYENKCG